jgi:hypothetical protein
MVKLRSLLEYIVRGLAWHYWGTYLRETDIVRPIFYPDSVTGDFAQIMNSAPNARRVSENIGRDTVVYRGIQDINEPQRMIWSICMYGGLVLSGESNIDGKTNVITEWWVFTGPAESLSKNANPLVVNPWISQ